MGRRNRAGRIRRVRRRIGPGAGPHRPAHGRVHRQIEEEAHRLPGIRAVIILSMPGMPDTTLRSLDSQGAGRAPDPRTLWLLVAGDGHLSMHPLPERGELVLGRDDGCDVRLQHAKISRRHARLVVIGGVDIAVEDVGSTNGIRLGDRKLDIGVAEPFRMGESLQLGPYVATLFDGRAGPRSDDGAPRAAIVIRDPTPQGAGELIGRVARSGVSVLVLAETGAGKEVLTRTIHDLSQRSGPFVAINCATLGESLLESELFGHERGAFTG